jgi:uncharacterized protein YndB with AHSA1/START domain
MPVVVREIVSNEWIVIDWNEPPTTVEGTFTAMGDNATFVSIRNFGFASDPDSRVKQAIDSTEGFSFVLAGAKAWLEQGVILGLVADRHPKGLPTE